jgi:hypothetical protein
MKRLKQTFTRIAIPWDDGQEIFNGSPAGLSSYAEKRFTFNIN